jgi:3,2-trans-enoyl-CoA isomerase
VEKKEGYAVVSLSKEPVNSMDLTLWQHLATAIEECDADPKVRGIVFTSGLHLAEPSVDYEWS